MQYTLHPAQLLGVQLPGDKNVTATSGVVREVEARGRNRGLGLEGAGWEVFTQRRKERAEKRKKKHTHTITDEKMRCEEGKMLLLEAFFSNQ